MEYKFENNQKIDGFDEPKKMRTKTPSRISYEAEVEVIQKQVGDLEEIRFKLGLSARKMAQLLLVDPSAWTRWTHKITQPPPHIYRALQWYLLLQEKSPGFTPQVFLASHWFSSKKREEENTIPLHEWNLLKTEVESLKTREIPRDLNQNFSRESAAKHNFDKLKGKFLWGLGSKKSLVSFTLGIILGYCLSRFPYK